MKKLYLFFLFLFTFTSVNAQLDTEHWFAPFADASNSEFDGYLYLSTNESTPFTVEVYNNETLISSTTISKGAPANLPIPKFLMVADAVSEKHVVTTKGLKVIGSRKFFANFRFAVPNHAEIITSKGKAALGTEFFSVLYQDSVRRNINNGTVGFLATQDGTQITVTPEDPTIIFSDGINRSSFTVSLNRGQSYILEAANSNGINIPKLTGAKIVSNHPISVTNGNYLSYGKNNANVDILMDQSVPLERLGTEFIVVKGQAGIDKGVEFPIIVATEDNTQIFLNDSTMPDYTLNSGDYLEVPSANYVNQGNNHYNIYIKSSKKIYVYQHLAGSDQSTYAYATGGFNFIPALSCFLPNSIDEISSIDMIGSMSYNTNLNIITQAGADVKINGVALNPSEGPFPVTGNNNWVTYVRQGISGNITITSSKAVTAGIAAGSGAVGYGGYFAGFNSVPVISRGGSCESNITLEVDNTYNSYQWYKDGIPYSGPGANTYILHNPPKGIYTVEISKDGCGSKMTPPLTLQSCTVKSTKYFTIGTCEPEITIDPDLSSSTQATKISSVKIDNAPTKGIATIDPLTGKITYTLTDITQSGTDTFSYSFSGDDSILPDTETVTVTVNYKDLITKAGQAFSCIDPDDKGIFDLTTASVSNDSNITSIEYFENYDATTNSFSSPIINKNAYHAPLKTIYARVTNEFGCAKMAPIELKFYPIPNINTVDFNSNVCDPNLDGVFEVNFAEVSTQIVSGYSDFDIYYYADAAYTTRLSQNWSFVNPTRVYVKVASRNGCVDATGFIDFEGLEPLPANNFTTVVCDNDLDGKVNVNLDSYNLALGAPAGSQFSYFLTEQDAKNNVSAIAKDRTISATVDYFVRIENSSSCPNVKKLTLNFSQPQTSAVLEDKIVCIGTTTELDAGPGFYAYLWSTGETTQTIRAGKGSYWVDLKTGTCIYRQNVEVTEGADPVIRSVIVEGSTVTVNAEGGIQPLEYSVDGRNFQSSNIINSVNRGLGKVYVRSAALPCKPVEKEFLIINLVNVITPNGDGINDRLDYSDLRIKNNVKISISDRYGILLFSGSNEKLVWEGKINGRPVPTGTYWYTLQWTEPDTQLQMSLKGWILVKNRN